MTHLCLARPEEGRSAPGDSWDCTRCRVLLLEAFRLPVEISETGLRNPFAGPINPSSWIASGSTFAQDGLEVEDLPHVTSTDIRWLSIPQTGIWFARCSCGWERTGRWEKSQGPTWAQGRAQVAADTHRDMREDEGQ